MLSLQVPQTRMHTTLRRVRSIACNGTKEHRQSLVNVRLWKMLLVIVLMLRSHTTVTLEAYIDKYSSLVSYLAPTATGTPASDPAPPEQTSNAISLQLPVVFDNPPLGQSFGNVLTDVSSTPYTAGQTATVQFIGANPRVGICFHCFSNCFCFLSWWYMRSLTGYYHRITWG